MARFNINYPNQLKVHYQGSNTITELSKYISDIIKENTVIVCIGTDRCIGDSLGPLVGSLLMKSNFKFPVYGTLQHPIHAVNLKEEMKDICKVHNDPYIIAIDACLGEENLIGSIQVRPGPIFPGKGVGKVLPCVGNTSIIGIVDKYNYEEFLPIHNIRLGLVMEMAEVIAKGLLAVEKTC